MESGIVIYSASHRTSSLSEREEFWISDAERGNFVRKVIEARKVSGIVSLETCNRIEYVVSSTDEETLSDFENELSRYQPKAKFSRLVGEDALRHLFRVVSGLDSMVIGEVQIAGQVKAAYYDALEAGLTDRALNRLFNRAFFISKKVRSSTRIGWGNVSVASLGVRLAEQVVGDLSLCRVAIIGAGEMAELLLRHIRTQGAKEIVILNRSEDKAWQLAKRYSVAAKPLQFLCEALEKSDLIVSAASAKNLISKEMLESSLYSSRTAKCVLDLSFPRSVEIDAGKLDGVYLYGIDDLKELSDENRREREESRSEAEFLIEEELSKYLSDRTHEELGEFSERVYREIEREERRLRRSMIRRGLVFDREMADEIKRSLESLASRLVHDKWIEIRTKSLKKKRNR